MAQDREETTVIAGAQPVDSAVRRAPWAAVTVALGCLSGFALSPNLWLSSRNYPLSPITEWLPAIPSPGDYVCFAILIVLLLTIVVQIIASQLVPRAFPHHRWLLPAFVALAGLYSLWDQSRWQPWFYQYLFMSLAMAFFPWGRLESSPGRTAASLNACRIIIAGIYFWSGLQKVNPLFVDEVHPWLLEPVLKQVPGSTHRVLLASGYVVPFVESGLGLLLLFRQSRQLAVLALALMHVMLMLVLGPLGHDWNTVVWPWNIAMPVLTFMLFWNTKDLAPWAIVRPRFESAHALILVLFLFMPVLNFVNHWDSYLSAALYSGNVLDGHVVVIDSIHQRLKPEVQAQFQFVLEENDFRMRISDWSMKELNVPAYPARRVFISVARQVAAAAEQPSDVFLIVEERPRGWSKTRDLTTYDALQLRAIASP